MIVADARGKLPNFPLWAAGDPAPPAPKPASEITFCMNDILNPALPYFGPNFIGFACGRLPMTGRLSLREDERIHPYVQAGVPVGAI
jgi:hypothetical protein